MTGFPPWGAPGVYIHATRSYTCRYTHAAHHSRPPYTLLTRLTDSPPAETGTCVYQHGRMMLHNGAVTYPAQPPAASPRCRNLSDSSLAIRAGREPSLRPRREGRGHSPFMFGLLAPPPSPSTHTHSKHPLPPFVLLIHHTYLNTHSTRTHTPNTYKHTRHVYTHAHAPRCAAKLRSIPDQHQHVGL